jgi:V/A-type H+-transporting ATPase subunit E
MGLQAILDAIHASGETQVREIEAAAQARVDEILAEARAESRRLHDEARAAAAAPAAVERARLLHDARFEALQDVGGVREELVGAALHETKRRLAKIRSEPVYRSVLRQLTVEALVALCGSLEEAGQARLEADPADKALLEEIVGELGLDLSIAFVLDHQGGLIAKSDDGRVVVINTLEARLERATSRLRCDLAALFDDGQLNGRGILVEEQGKECQRTTMATLAFEP